MKYLEADNLSLTKGWQSKDLAELSDPSSFSQSMKGQVKYGELEQELWS